jgi:hypothetical protein
MNLPAKLIKSQPNSLNDNYTFLQNLAKKYYRSNHNKSKKVTETTYLLDSCENNSYREDIMNWLFSLPYQERIKALTIENKWLTSMIYQMYQKYKQESKVKFQLKHEFFNEEEIYIQQVLTMQPNNYNLYANQGGDLSLENYFNTKNDNSKKS